MRTKKSVVGILTVSARAARFTEKALPDETALLAAFDASVPAYLADLLETRETLRAAVVSDTLGKRARRHARLAPRGVHVHGGARATGYLLRPVT